MSESGQDSRNPGSPVTMDRRRMLSATGTAIAVGVTGMMMVDDAAASESSQSTRTVWKLDPDWGYPRGPHGKTRLNSRASRAAALHRYALTSSDAERMNLHLCSFAPAVAVVVDADAFDELWNGLSYQWTSPWSGETTRLLDDRHVGRLAGGDETLRIALRGYDPTPEQPPAAAPGHATGGVAVPPEEVGRPSAGNTAASPAPSVPQSLALTGTGVRSTFMAGVAALSSGLVLLRSRRVRRADSPDPADDQLI